MSDRHTQCCWNEDRHITRGIKGWDNGQLKWCIYQAMSDDGWKVLTLLVWTNLNSGKVPKDYKSTNKVTLL